MAYNYPVIDLAPFITGGDAKKKEEVIEKLREACSDYGFFVAVNHGIPDQIMDKTMDATIDFFNLDLEEKLNITTPPGAPFTAGYTKEAAKSEHWQMCTPAPTNVFPANPPHFKETMEEMWWKLDEAAVLVQSLLNDCLRLPKGTLAKYNDDRGTDVLMGFHYLPATETDQTAVNAHRDSGLFSLVFENEVEGLEFLKDGEWIPIDHIPHSLVINVADALQALSNDKMKSPTHRILAQPGISRYAFVYAYLVAEDKWVEPMPELIGQTNESPKFKKFNIKEHMALKHVFKNPPHWNDVVGVHYHAIAPSVGATAVTTD
ncbi:unnamed protein product [Linum trigynum]|uniref:Fe2OG dioxygenase domain-containing protein n=1 Tax=Linum trigynum TaxID=586398 RepID=A0AAV2EZK5_9ROSI